MYHDHTTCRACGYAKAPTPGTKSASPDVMPVVFDLGVQPLANDFKKEGEPRAGYAPLKVLLCPRCNLAQLSVVVDMDILYSNYAYVTSPSATMQAHFERLTADITEEYPLATSVLEIGSNDGKLLAYMQTKHMDVIGIDPAENLCKMAEGRGVKTIHGFFYENPPTCKRFDAVIARHVFCHMPDWKGFILGLAKVTHDQSLVCIETPYVHDLLEKVEFDTVYHEHLSYLSIKSVVALLEGTKFYLHRVIRYPIHGGAVLLMLKVRGHGEAHASVQQFLDSENVSEMRWRLFAQDATTAIERLGALVRDFRAHGKRVVGLGASAKSTVWVNACGFTRKELDYIGDSTPGKWYTTSPGSNIPIVPEGGMFADGPDYVVMFCWNYFDECVKKNDSLLKSGTKFIVPVPSIRIIGADGQS